MTISPEIILFMVFTPLIGMLWAAFAMGVWVLYKEIRRDK